MGRPRQSKYRNVLEALLGSVARARLLTTFCTHPSEEFYARQLAKQLTLALSTIQEELGFMERWRILTARTKGRERLFQANQGQPVFPELRALVYKTTALGDVLRRHLKDLDGIVAAFIYGSVARGGEHEKSDLDLFVLGRPNQSALATALKEAEGKLGREITLAHMSMSEWQRRRQAGEGFIRELLAAPKIFVVGDEQALRRT